MFYAVDACSRTASGLARSQGTLRRFLLMALRLARFDFGFTVRSDHGLNKFVLSEVPLL